MNTTKSTITIQQGIKIGAVAGIIWGLLSLGINLGSGVFPLESSLFHNLLFFTSGGVIFGIIIGSFMSVIYDYLPFNNSISKGIFLSLSLWVLLRVMGMLLSATFPSRYVPVNAQTAQGLLLAVLLGGIVGFLWKKELRRCS